MFSLDYLGFCGADIHYGKAENKLKYSAKDKKTKKYDGTYEWLIALNIKKEYCKIIAKACKNVDNIYNIGKNPFFGCRLEISF